MRGRWLLLLALLLGLVTAGGVYAYLGAAERRLAGERETVPVLVARQDIPPRARVTAAMLEVRQLPRVARLPGALAKPEQAVGALTTAQVFAGEQVLPGRLAGGPAGGGSLSFQVAPGFRAVTVPVDKAQGLAGLLRPGDRVDVAVVVEQGQGADKHVLAALPVQDAMVLAVDRQVEETGKEAAGAPQTVTLQVTPAGAQALALAVEKGKIRLALRPADERGKVPLPRLEIPGLVEAGEKGGI